jgi:hypothetical protein
MKLYLTLTFIILGIAGLFLSGSLHEQIHQKIYSEYGIDSKVYYLEYFPNLATVPNHTQFESNCKDDCIKLQMENEIFDYPMMGIYLLLFIGLMFIIALLELKQ